MIELESKPAIAAFKDVENASRLHLHYFAWVRERVGRADEEVVVPGNLRTVGELVAWLVAADPEVYAYAFENPEVVQVALDKRHANLESPLAGAQSIAFFPPMTGG